MYKMKCFRSPVGISMNSELFKMLEGNISRKLTVWPIYIYILLGIRSTNCGDNNNLKLNDTSYNRRYTPPSLRNVRNCAHQVSR